MKNFWGGFMKKKISCKVIKSIPLRNEDVVSSYGDTLKLRILSSYLNFLHTKARPVVYTNKMEIENESVINNLPEQSIDFYA
jgi:hypothetical protein